LSRFYTNRLFNFKNLTEDLVASIGTSDPFDKSFDVVLKNLKDDVLASDADV